MKYGYGTSWKQFLLVNCTDNGPQKCTEKSLRTELSL